MIFSLVFYDTHCLFSGVVSESFRGSYNAGRIFGGEPAKITDFPYQLFLEIYEPEGFGMCGASIIENSWALTAAHCVFGFSAEQISLRSGSSYWDRGGTIHNATKAIIHPKFSSDWLAPLDYDVAIIKVSSPFHYNEVTQKISLSSKTPSTETPAVVSGWGFWNYEGERPDQLQKLDVYIMEFEECNEESLSHYFHVTPRMLCTYSREEGKHFCYGDSGGPLVVDNVQVGIMCFLNPILGKYLPSVYTDVSKIREWVTSTIEQETRYY